MPSETVSIMPAVIPAVVRPLMSTVPLALMRSDPPPAVEESVKSTVPPLTAATKVLTTFPAEALFWKRTMADAPFATMD